MNLAPSAVPPQLGAHQTAIPFFAGVVMLDVILPLERPLEFLQEASRVLKPSGRLVMIETGNDNASRASSTIASPKEAGGHERRPIRAGRDQS